MIIPCDYTWKKLGPGYEIGLFLLSCVIDPNFKDDTTALLMLFEKGPKNYYMLVF